LEGEKMAVGMEQHLTCHDDELSAYRARTKQAEEALGEQATQITQLQRRIEGFEKSKKNSNPIPEAAQITQQLQRRIERPESGQMNSNPIPEQDRKMAAKESARDSNLANQAQQDTDVADDTNKSVFGLCRELREAVTALPHRFVSNEQLGANSNKLHSHVKLRNNEIKRVTKIYTDEQVQKLHDHWAIETPKHFVSQEHFEGVMDQLRGQVGRHSMRFKERKETVKRLTERMHAAETMLGAAVAQINGFQSQIETLLGEQAAKASAKASAKTSARASAKDLTGIITPVISTPTRRGTPATPKILPSTTSPKVSTQRQARQARQSRQSWQALPPNEDSKRSPVIMISSPTTSPTSAVPKILPSTTSPKVSTQRQARQARQARQSRQSWQALPPNEDSKRSPVIMISSPTTSPTSAGPKILPSTTSLKVSTKMQKKRKLVPTDQRFKKP
jgi:hypothetical protein